jgi:hypothetical protein
VVRFRIVQEIRAPPAFVVNWWLDYRSDDPQLTPGLVRRKVERIDENRIHLSTTAEFAGRLRTTDGTVTRTGPANWHMTGHVISNGIVVSTLQTAYSVASTSIGSRVSADFEFVGRSLAWRLALAVSGYSLRRRQRTAFRDYARAIEQAYSVPTRPPEPPPIEPPAQRSIAS